MAVEEGQVTPPVEGSAQPADGNTSANDPSKTAKPAQGTDLAKTGWDAERAAFVRDLQKERQARQKHESDLTTTRAELEAEKRRVQALAGVNPQDPNAANDDLIRQRMKQLYPWISDFSAEDLKAVRELKESKSQLDSTVKDHWLRHSRQMLSSVEKDIAKELGGDLSPRQVRQVRMAYAEMVEADPSIVDRYENGDEKLAADFVKQWTEDWVEPIKRKITAAEAARARRVPFGKDRSVVGSTQKPIDYTDPKAVEDLLVSGYKERGGTFGR